MTLQEALDFLRLRGSQTDPVTGLPGNGFAAGSLASGTLTGYRGALPASVTPANPELLTFSFDATLIHADLGTPVGGADWEIVALAQPLPQRYGPRRVTQTGTTIRIRDVFTPSLFVDIAATDTGKLVHAVMADLVRDKNSGQAVSPRAMDWGF
jgi:hypothetical protein